VDIIDAHLLDEFVEMSSQLPLFLGEVNERKILKAFNNNVSIAFVIAWSALLFMIIDFLRLLPLHAPTIVGFPGSLISVRIYLPFFAQKGKILGVVQVVIKLLQVRGFKSILVRYEWLEHNCRLVVAWLTALCRDWHAWVLKVKR